MSHKEIERFTDDIKSNQELVDEFSSGVLGLDQLVEKAREKGYDFNADEAKEFVRKMNPKGTAGLTDEDLESVAGGGVAVVTATDTVTQVALISPFVTSNGPTSNVAAVATVIGVGQE